MLFKFQNPIHPMSISLQTLIRRRKVNTRVMALLQQHAVEAIIQARERGETGIVDESSFVFSHDFRTMEVYTLLPNGASEREVVQAFGEVLLNAIIASPHHPKRLIAIAQACLQGHITDLADLDLRLERRLANTIYLPLIAIILSLLLLLYHLHH